MKMLVQYYFDLRMTIYSIGSYSYRYTLFHKATNRKNKYHKFARYVKRYMRHK